MRFNETCTLVAKEYVRDFEGVEQVTDTPTEVFCNEFSVGVGTWSSMYEIGMSINAELQVRTCDYAGQRDVFYKGKWYSVEYVKTEGDFTRLTLRHQQSDSDEFGESGETGRTEG